MYPIKLQKNVLCTASKSATKYWHPLNSLRLATRNLKWPIPYSVKQKFMGQKLVRQQVLEDKNLDLPTVFAWLALLTYWIKFRSTKKNWSLQSLYANLKFWQFLLNLVYKLQNGNSSKLYYFQKDIWSWRFIGLNKIISQLMRSKAMYLQFEPTPFGDSPNLCIKTFCVIILIYAKNTFLEQNEQYKNAPAR